MDFLTELLRRPPITWWDLLDIGLVAFGEPISHRQAVAFDVANIAIELDGRLAGTIEARSFNPNSTHPDVTRNKLAP